MKLYNTLGRKFETLSPENKRSLQMYSCGPTVYDYAHVGNLRAFVFADTLRRALEVSGFEVKHVMNITDVGHLSSDADHGEDKLEKGAAREGKTVWDVAKDYTSVFVNDAKSLNILAPNAYDKSPDGYARATDFIDVQIDMVKRLLEKDIAYITEQAIYFDVTKVPEYGQLSGQKLADKEVAVRSDVVEDSAKHHPYDFAVWFFTVGRFKDHAMRWDSPWGQGFPGWHLECSAIIHKTLHEPIDIHTGGVDHIGTHHTNEIAQTRAAFDTDLANIWAHNEFVLVDGKKMSKSLGNFYTLKDIVAKGFDPLAFRLLVLQSHYRSELNFTWESLEAAQRRLEDLRAWADLRHQPSTDDIPTELDELFRDTRQNILESLGDDLNTSSALSHLGTLINYMLSRPVPGVDGKHTDGMLSFIDAVFGLGLDKRPDITKEQKKLIHDRETARKNQDWEQSDNLRDKLTKDSLGLRDTDYGTQWYRI